MMSFTTDTYIAIKDKLARGEYQPGSTASRLAEYYNQIKIVFAIDVHSMQREAYISLPEIPTSPQFPKWKGISIDIAYLPVYDASPYVRLKQLPESEDYIFDIVIEDLRHSVEVLHSKKECTNTVIDILTKWKKFFQADRNLVMSDELQEGLYGELCFLERAIRLLGIASVMNWVGGERETHDFYFGNHAVEVKATSRKEPYSVQITSEYQLDSTDIVGRLYLYVTALRKSKQSGERLPEIIQRIQDTLYEDLNLRNQFTDKLSRYGYIDGTEDLYTLRFFVRDTYALEVRDGFPKIVRKMLDNRVSKVSYDLSISTCMEYVCTEENLFKVLEENR